MFMELNQDSATSEGTHAALTQAEENLKSAILERLKNYTPGKEKQLADEILESLRLVIQE
jgi:hypothetical protein